MRLFLSKIVILLVFFVSTPSSAGELDEYYDDIIQVGGSQNLLLSAESLVTLQKALLGILEYSGRRGVRGFSSQPMPERIREILCRLIEDAPGDEHLHQIDANSGRWPLGLIRREAIVVMARYRWSSEMQKKISDYMLMNVFFYRIDFSDNVGSGSFEGLKGATRIKTALMNVFSSDFLESFYLTVKDYAKQESLRMQKSRFSSNDMLPMYLHIAKKLSEDGTKEALIELLKEQMNEKALFGGIRVLMVLRMVLLTSVEKNDIDQVVGNVKATRHESSSLERFQRAVKFFRQERDAPLREAHSLIQEICGIASAL